VEQVQVEQVSLVAAVAVQVAQLQVVEAVGQAVLEAYLTLVATAVVLEDL
jgi:hypothetical protein